MKQLRIVLAMLVAVALVAVFSSQAGAQGKGRFGKLGKGVFGEITDVTTADGVTTLTVKQTPFGKKKKSDDDTPPPELKTYMVKIAADAKITKAPMMKGDDPEDAKVADLAKGVRVFCKVPEDTDLATTLSVTSDTIMIVPARKKKVDAE